MKNEEMRIKNGKTRTMRCIAKFLIFTSYFLIQKNQEHAPAIRSRCRDAKDSE